MVPEETTDSVKPDVSSSQESQGSSSDRHVMDVLSGRLDPRSLDKMPSKVIRMFVACTSTDMTQERNVLIEKVYPRLREYTRAEHSLEFQAVDIRWGIEDTSWDDHSELEFLLNQLGQSQKLSAGPNFLALVGQRYGHRPLPSEIPAVEYELIRSTLNRHRNRQTRDAPILDKWYKKDTNAVPPVYVLQPISSGVPDYYSEDDSLREEAQKDWDNKSKLMRGLIQRGAEYCVAESTLDVESKHQYVMSELDCLIKQGLQHGRNPERNALVFIRTIIDLKNYVDHDKTPKFMEVVYNDKLEKIEIDKESKQLLDRVKEQLIPHYVPKSQVLDSSILWKFDDGIHPELHKDYLDEFAERMYNALVELMDASVPFQEAGDHPPLYDEVLRHLLLTKQRCKHFHGREDIMQQIQGYVTGSSHLPLVITGVSGSGKTSIMAQAQILVPFWLTDEVTVISRYLGLTTDSADVRQVINSICHQMAMVFGHDPGNIPTDYKGLLWHFYDLLRDFPAEKKLVIFLDSLDQLNPEYNAHYMQWLPPRLKSNVKLILSTLPDKHDILERLKSEIICNTKCFVDVGELGAIKCTELLQTWLEGCNRTLSSSQEEILKEAFENCSLPLYARMLFDEVISWRSYSVVEGIKLGADCRSYINNLFDHLEAKYGNVLVSHVLAYLTASTTGLSDCEMEDLLSLDDVVLDEVYKSWHPSTRRIPHLIWLRIRREIDAFLQITEADGYTVFFWYHRQFIEIATERYLSDSAFKKKVHGFIADYYLGKWHGKKVKFTYSDDVVSLLKLSNSQGNAVRLVPSQPLTFQSSKGATRYNRRKYDQVPRHLFLSGRLEELNTLVLFSYEWLYNKIKVLSLQHIIADFSLNPGVEASLVESALRASQAIISTNVNNMPAELTGRLLAYYTTHPNIRQLIDQCDVIGLQHCALVPTYPYHAVPGSPLQHELECKTPVQFLHVIDDARYIWAKSKTSQQASLFDLATGELVKEIVLSTGDMYLTPSFKHFLIIDDLAEKSVKVHEGVKGRYQGQLIPMNHIQLAPKEKYRLGPVDISDERMCIVVTTESSYMCIASVPDIRFIEIVGLDGKCTMCKMSPDKRFVFCNSNKTLLSYNLETLQHIANVDMGFKPRQMLFVTEGLRAFVLSEYENHILVLHIRDGFAELSYTVSVDDVMPNDIILEISLSNSEKFLLVRGQNSLLVYDILEERFPRRFSRPDGIPGEFKLPRKEVQDIVFTQAKFSRDDRYLIATIFRNVYIWNINDGLLVNILTAPVGIISDLIISTSRAQIITHLQESPVIQVWNFEDALGDIGSLDRLTSAPAEIIPTADGSVAYVRCHNSDEIGVIDMSNGQLIDLLTHESEVTSANITYDGSHMFAALKNRRQNQLLNKIWDMNQRKIVHEFGQVTGYCVAMRSERTFINICQRDITFCAPFYIDQFRMEGEKIVEVTIDVTLNHVLKKPFITKDDKYLVVLSAEDYDKATAQYLNPVICSFTLDHDFEFRSFGPSEYEEFFATRKVVDIKPYENNPYSIIALFKVDFVSNNTIMGSFTSNRSFSRSGGSCMTNGHGDIIESFANDSKGERSSIELGKLDHNMNGDKKSFNTSEESLKTNEVASCYGFFILDVCSGAVTKLCDMFLTIDVPLDLLLIDKDATVCVDEMSNVYTLLTGDYSRQVQPTGISPRLMINNGKALVYFDKNEVYVIRFCDGREIARCDVHTEIVCVSVCLDERTILIGCVDGTVTSYVLIDTLHDTAQDIISGIRSRMRVPTPTDMIEGRMSRTWDRVDSPSSVPRSRPPSAVFSLSPSDKDKLKQVRPVRRFRPRSDSLLYAEAQSHVCAIM